MKAYTKVASMVRRANRSQLFVEIFSRQNQQDFNEGNEMCGFQP